MSDREFGRQKVIYVGSSSMGTVMIKSVHVCRPPFLSVAADKDFQTATSSSSDLKKSEGIIIYLLVETNK